MLTPVKITKHQLLETLKAIIKHVEEDDSFGGKLEYEATEFPPYFMVSGSLLVGNAEGQGSTMVIGNAVPQEDLSKMDLETAKDRISNEVYAAALFMEKLEHAGKIFGNGHHCAQRVAAVAVSELEHRWKEKA